MVDYVKTPKAAIVHGKYKPIVYVLPTGPIGHLEGCEQVGLLTRRLLLGMMLIFERCERIF